MTQKVEDSRLQEVKIGARVTMAGVVEAVEALPILGCKTARVKLDGSGGWSMVSTQSFLTVENPGEPLKIGDEVCILNTSYYDPVEIISICDGLAWLRCKDGDFFTFTLKNLKRI